MRYVLFHVILFQGSRSGSHRVYFHPSDFSTLSIRTQASSLAFFCRKAPAGQQVLAKLVRRQEKVEVGRHVHIRSGMVVGPCQANGGDYSILTTHLERKTNKRKLDRPAQATSSEEESTNQEIMLENGKINFFPLPKYSGQILIRLDPLLCNTPFFNLSVRVGLGFLAPIASPFISATFRRAAQTCLAKCHNL